MNPEILEYLAIVEAKIATLLQDVRNIRERLEAPSTPRLSNPQAPTFFDALSSENARPRQ